MPKDIVSGRIDPSSIAWVTDDTAHRLERHRLRTGTILLPRRGDITKHALVSEATSGWLCGTGCLQVFVGGGEVLPEFLGYYLDLQEVGGWLEQHAVGTTMLNLSAKIVSKLPVRYPRRVRQQEIVRVLQHYDSLIANNQRRITLLEEAARQLYREWFVRLRFPGAEHSAIVEGVPEGWRRTTLGDICSKIGSGFTPRGGEASYVESGVTLIRSQNVYDDRFDESGLAFLTEEQAEEMEGVTVASRDVLLNITGASVARCCMVLDSLLPARVNQHVMILRVADDSVSPHFVLGTLNSGLHKRQLHSLAQKGATRQALTKEMMENFGLVVASSEIMREFDEIVEPNFQLRQNLTRQNTKLRTARDLLLPRLMSGQLTV